MSREARQAILDRIRRAVGERDAPLLPAVAALWEAVPRGYDRSPKLTRAEALDLLEARLLDYDAEVTRARQGEVAAVLEAILLARGEGATLVAPGFPESWRPRNVTLTVDRDLSIRELDRFSGVLTGATLAIADTGTVVLQHGPGQGRRAATLVPDFHLCVVRAEDVVEGVPEAFAQLRATAELPTTFVSGPSATADIEMTRIKGVHGPRFLHVILVEL